MGSSNPGKTNIRQNTGHLNRRKEGLGRGQNRTFWSDGNVLYVDVVSI